ncbi:sporulation protein YpjB [Cytobacillus suaedae]|nr:sporulation protein YpjB [Cytobacillus suaedae]
MKLRILSVLFIFILLLPNVTNAESTDNWAKLDELSGQALLMVKQERYEEAKQLLQQFSNDFLLNFRNGTFSMDELRVITVTHNSALEAVTSTSNNYEERLTKVTQFRLVVDAISSEHQPLWTEMEDSIMTTFSVMKQHVLEDGDNQSYQHQLNIFLKKFDIIHPSIQVDLPSSQIQKMDSHIHFLDSYRNEGLKKSTRIQQMEQMELDLKELFDKMTEDEADPSLIWVMISTGSIIILTLSYVGWRKYKGDKQKKLPKRDTEE